MVLSLWIEPAHCDLPNKPLYISVERPLCYSNPHIFFVGRIDGESMGKWFSLLVLAKDALVVISIFSMMVLSTIGFFNSCYCSSGFLYRFGGAVVRAAAGSLLHLELFIMYTWPPSSLTESLKQVGCSKNIDRKVRPSGQPIYQELSLLRNELFVFSSTNTTTNSNINSTHVSTICSNRHARYSS